MFDFVNFVLIYPGKFLLINGLFLVIILLFIAIVLSNTKVEFYKIFILGFLSYFLFCIPLSNELYKDFISSGKLLTGGDIIKQHSKELNFNQLKTLDYNNDKTYILDVDFINGELNIFKIPDFLLDSVKKDKEKFELESNKEYNSVKNKVIREKEEKEQIYNKYGIK